MTITHTKTLPALAAIHGLFYSGKSGPAGATNTNRGLTATDLARGGQYGSHES
jgi:hypothetical protein